ncbi:MAG: helix-turn-helix domain-containing protein [Maritimibacter sp.]
MKHPVDVHVGRRIRHTRWSAGKTQKEVADSLKISFQQLQKYETAGNRVSASKLFELADEFGVPITHFFEGLQVNLADDQTPVIHADFLQDREAVELIRMYYQTPESLREQIFGLARAMAKGKKN